MRSLSPSHKELGQVPGRFVKGAFQTRRHRVQALAALTGRPDQRFVRTVAHVEKTDVVILAVESAQGRLVIEGKVVRSDAPRIRGSILQINPKRPSPIGLIFHPADAAGRQPRVQSAKVPLPRS